MSQSSGPTGWLDGSTSDGAAEAAAIERLALELWFMILEHLSPEDWLALRRGSKTILQAVDSVLANTNWFDTQHQRFREPLALEYDQKRATLPPPAPAPGGLILGNPIYHFAHALPRIGVPRPEQILDPIVDATRRLERVLTRIAGLKSLADGREREFVVPEDAITDSDRYREAKAKTIRLLNGRVYLTPREVVSYAVCVFIFVCVLYVWFTSDSPDDGAADCSPKFKARQLL
jgi:F-box domain